MNEKKTRIIDQIRNSMRSPIKGFVSITEKDLWKGAFIILLVALFSAITSFNYTSKSPFQLPLDSASNAAPSFGPQSINPETVRGNFILLSTVRDGLKAITGWLVTGVIIHIFARLLGGNGGFKRLLALTGFASIPQVLQQIIRLIDAYTISRETLISLITVQAITKSLPDRFISQVITTFSIFGIWTFALTIIAVSANYKYSKGKAATATIIAYLVLIMTRILLPI